MMTPHITGARNIKDPLAVPEILSTVFLHLDSSQLDNVGEWVDDGAVKSLATCARVCSRWSDVALDILWRHTYLETFVNLLLVDQEFVELDSGSTVSKLPLIFIIFTYSICRHFESIPIDT